MQSQWAGEILVPDANLAAYRLIFEAETWLRRVCLAALLIEKGPAWASDIDTRLRTQLEHQSRMNASRWYLGVDAEEELLWSTSHKQLAELIELVGRSVTALSGLDSVVIRSRLEAIAQVRHAMAHSRALSATTLTVLRGDWAALRAGLDRFKDVTLYNSGTIAINVDDAPEDCAQLATCFIRDTGHFTHHHLFFASNDHFVFFVRLPTDQPVAWPDPARLRSHLGMSAHLLCCVLANKSGNELQFVLPRHLPLHYQLEALRKFMDYEVLTSAWTTVPPADQDPGMACWPRLWYYKNRRDDLDQ